MDLQTLLKERLATKAITAISFFFILFACSSVKNIENDYILVNKIIKETKERDTLKSIDFELNSSNDYAIYILNHYHLYSESNNLNKLDSLRQSVGLNYVKDTGVVNQIFDDKEYEHMVSQKNRSKWDLDLIDQSYLSNGTKSGKSLRISKPIYTSNNKFALVSISEMTRTWLSVYKKENGNWEKVLFFAPIITQSKAKKHIKY